jgi:hypothetical protein
MPKVAQNEVTVKAGPPDLALEADAPLDGVAEICLLRQ